MSTKRAAKSVAAEPVKKGPTVYVGPSLPSLSRYTIFKRGELMPHIEKLLAECPNLKRLIVPVEKLGEIQRRLTDNSSLESSWYAEVQKHFKGA